MRSHCSHERLFFGIFYNIIRIMSLPPFSVAIFLYYQTHSFHTLTIFIAGSDNIDSCSVDTAVTENVCEFSNVFFDIVKSTCEQVPKIMGKYLLRIYPCLITNVFHFPPNVGVTHLLAASGYKYCTGRNLLLCCIAEQFLLQFSDNEY